MSQLGLWPNIVDDDGSLTLGTPWSKAVTDLIKAAIEVQTYSAGYPTLSPADIIEEVAAARGNATSLSNRLNATTDADGNFLSGIVQRLSTDLTAYTNTNAVLTSLAQYSMPAGKLATNGQVLRITAYGTFAANANNKSIRFTFGAAGSITFTASTLNGGAWRAVVEVFRVDGTNQLIIGALQINAQATENIVTAAATETLSGAIALGFKAQGVATADITQKANLVEYIR